MDTTQQQRTKQILELVLGRLNKQIAGELGTIGITVKIHRGQVMQKMGAESVPHLVRITEQLDRGKETPN